jgi:hypothetical protein
VRAIAVTASTARAAAVARFRFTLCLSSLSGTPCGEGDAAAAVYGLKGGRHLVTVR